MADRPAAARTPSSIANWTLGRGFLWYVVRSDYAPTHRLAHVGRFGRSLCGLRSFYPLTKTFPPRPETWVCGNCARVMETKRDG